MAVNGELDRRYDGDAGMLYSSIGSVRKSVLIDAVKEMLENGCFCPSCMLNYLEYVEVVEWSVIVKLTDYLNGFHVLNIGPFTEVKKNDEKASH